MHRTLESLKLRTHAYAIERVGPEHAAREDEVDVERRDDRLLLDVAEEGQLGLPFLVFPASVWYMPALFEEAGLNMPPTEWDSNYVMPDGTEVEWNWDTVTQVAKLLTIDENGLSGHIVRRIRGEIATHVDRLVEQLLLVRLVLEALGDDHDLQGRAAHLLLEDLRERTVR